MRKGKLQQFDSPMNIYERPANCFVAEFVGSPSMNLVEGQVDFANGRFNARNVSIALNESQLQLLKNHNSKEIILGIRPEHIAVNHESQRDAIGATVYVTELMGNETFVFVNMGDNKLIARAPANFRADMDTQVMLHFAIEKLHFFDHSTLNRIDP